ncbi:MAG: type III PLP-dependent enzyme [Methylococcaceae bacterium]|nr:type III PLP-dependent enzyme [Methylococcaceae bacterium]
MSRISIASKQQMAFYKQMAEQHGTPLLILDCGKVLSQYQALQKALPNVSLHYAIKSMPNEAILRTLVDAGAGFDVATSREIELLQPLADSPRSMIHTHPVKRDADIRAALRYGCTTFVIDNVWELEKFIPFRHRVGLLLRIGFRAGNAVVDLSRKFGCHVDEALLLIRRAMNFGLHVKGLSFHVGSQCGTGEHHARAIRVCRELMADTSFGDGVPLSVLDIGGGFPVDYLEPVSVIDEFCEPIRRALSELPGNIQVWAEPGRFLSAPAGTAVSRIMGKARRNGVMWYYLDDGLYGSYSGQLFDHMRYPLQVFSDVNEREAAVIAGPTCDSIDVIAEEIELPPLEIGDLIIGHRMGAYTAASATDFNFFERAKIVAVNAGRGRDSATVFCATA